MATETEIETANRAYFKALVPGPYGHLPALKAAIEAVDRVRAEDTRDALRYLIERVDREFKDQDQPPELDFVLMAANEVRHLAGFSGGASAGGRT